MGDDVTCPGPYRVQGADVYPDLNVFVCGAADLVLIMSVNPGFGGQKFIEYQVEKIRKLRAMCDAIGADPWIEVDGGVTPANAYKVRLRPPSLGMPLLATKHCWHCG